MRLFVRIFLLSIIIACWTMLILLFTSFQKETNKESVQPDISYISLRSEELLEYLNIEEIKEIKDFTLTFMEDQSITLDMEVTHLLTYLEKKDLLTYYPGVSSFVDDNSIHIFINFILDCENNEIQIDIRQLILDDFVVPQQFVDFLAPVFNDYINQYWKDYGTIFIQSCEIKENELYLIEKKE